MAPGIQEENWALLEQGRCAPNTLTLLLLGLGGGYPLMRRTSSLMCV